MNVEFRVRTWNDSRSWESIEVLDSGEFENWESVREFAAKILTESRESRKQQRIKRESQVVHVFASCPGWDWGKEYDILDT